jgi:hypothetical protein
MPINGISVGIDVYIILTDQNGFVNTCRIKAFNAKQKTSDKETIALDGINRHVVIPIGWEGDIEMERTSSLVDDYIANLENNYYLGQNIPTATITETITEADASVTQYQYVGVVLRYQDAGMWKGDDLVTLKLNFSSQQRLKIQ